MSYLSTSQIQTKIEELDIQHIQKFTKRAELDIPARKPNLWKVNIPESEKREINVGIIINEKFGGQKLDSDLKPLDNTLQNNPLVSTFTLMCSCPSPLQVFREGLRKVLYFPLNNLSIDQKKISNKVLNSHQSNKALYPHRTIEEVLRNATNHIYGETINASEIPVINCNPSFILHALPDFSVSDNNGYGGYIQEESLSVLFDKICSLFELFCKTYGIYLSLNVGHDSKNLGSILDLNQYFTNDPENNTVMAPKFIRAILIARLFILTNLLEFHKNHESHDRNFTPKQWLLMQLLPIQISGENFWIQFSWIKSERSE
ncbi:13446_t:CDS:2 [Funneliformis geosporum]|uniref:13446_t:CDS:1 n=1 Tax=Funneliformis geosporum TaxID=1117311 RepID=A0A9W4SLB8_9GLOM|nr:13446_t:CDS:2 [Funneliformis geosporum]